MPCLLAEKLSNTTFKNLGLIFSATKQTQRLVKAIWNAKVLTLSGVVRLSGVLHLKKHIKNKMFQTYEAEENEEQEEWK